MNRFDLDMKLERIEWTLELAMFSENDVFNGIIPNDNSAYIFKKQHKQN